MWSQSTKMEIIEIEPHEKLWSSFQLLPMFGAQFSFTVAFELSYDIIEVMYNYKLAFLKKVPMKKWMMKMAKKTLNP